MNGGLLPLALLCAALGLALAATPVKTAWISLGVLATMAIAALAILAGYQHDAPLLLGFWGSTMLTAALVYLPRGLTGLWAFLASANAGIWVGAFAGSAGGWRALAWAMPLALLFLPAGWLIRRGFGIGAKIVASWIVAVSLLAGMVSMVPTPGYAPDHKE